MTNEELAELERQLAEIDGKKKGQLTSLCVAYERLGRIVSRDRDYWIATAREAEALRAENARLRDTIKTFNDVAVRKGKSMISSIARTTLAKIKDATDAD